MSIPGLRQRGEEDGSCYDRRHLDYFRLARSLMNYSYHHVRFGVFVRSRAIKGLLVIEVPSILFSTKIHEISTT